MSMKRLAVSLAALFLLGDCVQLTKGIFVGSYWIITAVHADSTYDLEDKTDYLVRVRQSYLKQADRSFCSDYPRRRGNNHGSN